MSREKFQELIEDVTHEIQDQPLDAELEGFLNERFPAGDVTFDAIAAACREAVAAGWMCDREQGGIKYGRVLESSADIGGFSVDVVEMSDVVGPQHLHPKGEVDMIMPLDGDAKFDGHGAGWCVYGPGSTHRPTVTGGRALVLYLLPQGAIEFIR